MEPLAIAFILQSTYDLLPNAIKLKQCGYIDTDACALRQREGGTLRRVLTACPQSK